ncbi:MAG: histidine phosphotransferase [Alphaproteobacteria bacterium]|nr:histidine phosphotransferase [Alphaproteobacteria bacterium]
MEPMIELRVAELLASRLCHDLVSPVGAVNSGIELLTEFGDDPGGESMQLIATSAKAASEKLQFFRIAYGNAGSGANIPLGDGLRLIEPVCANQRTTVAIEDKTAGALPGTGAVKLLLNIALLVGDCLPRGGELRVAVGPEMNVGVSAAGEGAGIEAGLRAGLDGSLDVDALDAKTAHAFFTGRVAERMGVECRISEQTDGVEITADLPAAS